MLSQTNVGYFGFGTAIKDQQSLEPTSYDYNIDPYQLRWKTIDELYGAVITGAIQTYDFKYYYYSAYYTYQNDKIYSSYSYSMDVNQGTSCQGYYEDKINCK